MQKKVAIIGTGHCGLAMAADLKNRGFSVCLYSHPEHDQKWNSVRKSGTLTSSGLIQGKWEIDHFTQSLKEAADFADNLILALPSYAQDSIFDLLTPHLNEDHKIINLNGNLSSCILHEKLGDQTTLIVETNAAPHASRANKNGEVTIMGTKKFIPIAGVPAHLSHKQKENIAALFQCDLEWHDSILAISLQAYNGVLHPAPTLLNAGWTEAQDRDFLFYKDGLSPAVGKVVEQIDLERLEIARRYGFTTLRTTLQALQEIYGGQHNLIHEFARNAKVYEKIKATPDINGRYLTEDIPYVLVPWYELGKASGYEAATIKSMIDLASLMHGTDYMKTGRTYEKIISVVNAKNTFPNVENAVYSAVL